VTEPMTRLRPSLITSFFSICVLLR